MTLNGLRDTIARAATVVIAFILTTFVKLSVPFEISTRSQCPQPEDRIGARSAPSDSRNVHSILGKVPARTFDDPRSYGEVRRQIFIEGRITWFPGHFCHTPYVD